MKKKRDGYAILAVLIALAILLALYAMQMKVLFVPKNGPALPSGLQQHPWQQEDLLVPDEQTVKLPRPPKPTLDEPFTAEGPVRTEHADRGTVSVTFDTDGRVRGTWQAQYTSNNQTYSITAAMNGNINIKQTYEDATGKDTSLLFFIAKGNYQKRTLLPAESADENGTAYLLGWLGTDHAVTGGYITLTTDRTWAAVYEWAAGPADK